MKSLYYSQSDGAINDFINTCDLQVNISSEEVEVSSAYKIEHS